MEALSASSPFSRTARSVSPFAFPRRARTERRPRTKAMSGREMDARMTTTVATPPIYSLSRPSSADAGPKRAHAIASRLISAPAKDVYAILADYRGAQGHASILPRPFFVSMHVEQGGIGEGTVVQVTMKVLGRWQDLRLEVTEPMPGEILRERDLLSGSVTTFAVEPRRAGKASRVVIETTWPRKPGVRAWLEGRITAMVARRIYEKELDLLARRAQVERSSSS